MAKIAIIEAYGKRCIVEASNIEVTEDDVGGRRKVGIKEKDTGRYLWNGYNPVIIVNSKGDQVEVHSDILAEGRPKGYRINGSKDVSPPHKVIAEIYKVTLHGM